MAFGNYAVTAASTSTGIIAVTCTSSTTYTLGLDKGIGAGATETARLMTGPSGALLGYGLFQDAAYSTNWGQASGTESQTGTGAAQNFTVYGKIPANEYAAPGSYSDTVTATITY
jgi:spore coat protein U-like protein